mmetsp:Transcript_17212/g.48011  ORF Transcript_17212/g.48011 Transcript_17212/m.48011 type:complete len:1169 (+) Transcript_17212:260-3766(+)
MVSTAKNLPLGEMRSTITDGTEYKEQDSIVGQASEYQVELAKRAAELGLNTSDPVSWSRFQWIAEEFYRAPLPEPWTAYADDHGQVFYYDHKTGESVWSHPLLQTFKNLYNKCQEEPYLHRYYRDLFNNLRQYSDQTKGWWALNLLASPNNGPPPTPDEVLDMASYLGLDHMKEYSLMWVAKQAVQVALPPNWEELEDPDGNVYFYDKATGKSSIKHPMDDYFFALVQEERRKIKKGLNQDSDPEALLRQRWIPFVDETSGAAYYYSFVEGVRLDYPPWENHFQLAATKIQRAFRRHHVDYAAQTKAAITIQKLYRGYVVRDAVTAWKRECAALCIQTTWRMYWASKNLYKVLAAIHIQRAWRHHSARSGAKHAIAAMVVQRSVRAHLARRELAGLQARRDAAMTLQRVQRGRKGRQQAKRRKYESLVQKRVERETEAVVVLQAIQRGRLARKKAAVLRRRQDRVKAATTLQAAWRGRTGRQEAFSAKQQRSAIVIQRQFRMHRSKKQLKHHKASRTLQTWIRGVHARRRLRFMKQHRAMGFHSAATEIQRHWRGFHYRRTRQTKAAAIKIQANWRGHHYRHRTKQHVAATKVQSVWKGHNVRRKYDSDRIHKVFVALRLQYLYRRMVRIRQAAIRRMMLEYSNDMASVIRATWLAHKHRMAFLQYRENKDIMHSSATKIQSVWKGHKARVLYKLMSDPEAWAAHNAVLIQKEWRRFAAQKARVHRYDLSVERLAIVDQLRPMYIEMYNLPDKVVRPSGHKLLDKLIIQDVCKEMEDALGEEAVEALRSKIAALREEKKSRVAVLDKMHHTLAIHWRLMSLPEDRWLELPPGGAPGWVSNKVVKKCKGELDRVKKLRKKAFDPLAQAAWQDLQRLRQELGMTDKWRKKLQFRSPADEELLDAIIEELRILEDLYMPLSPLVPLVAHLEAHLQTQDDMLAATDPMMVAAAKQKALKRLSRHESKIQEMQEEFPNVVSETLERLNQLEHVDLPVPVQLVYEMFGLPTEDELAADMERYMQTKTGRSNSEAVLRSIIHYRKVKKMINLDKKAKRKKKREEGVGGSGLRQSSSRDIARENTPPPAKAKGGGSPLVREMRTNSIQGRQASLTDSNGRPPHARHPSTEALPGGSRAEFVRTSSSNAFMAAAGGGEQPPGGVKRRPARRKAKRAN